MDVVSLESHDDFDNAEHEDEATTDNEEEPEEIQYQIRPKLEDKFKPLSAKEVIHNVLFDYLSTKVYSREESQIWSKEIADTIRDKIKKLDYKKYKFIVNVVLGQRNGAGAKIGCRCIWDVEADSYAHDSFVNETLFCVAAVYAIYTY